MKKRSWFVVSFLGWVGSAAAQFQPASGSSPCASTGLPANCQGVTAMQWVEVPLCVPDMFSNDAYDGCPDLAAHYLVVPPACDPWTTSDKFPVMVLFRGQGNGYETSPDACCTALPPHEHYTPYSGTPSGGNPDLMEEASRRGWYAVSVLGVPGNQYWYGSPQGLYGAERAVKDFLTKCPDADRDRIVGVGFSMGGTNVLSYGARHLDPQSDNGMFAAMAVLSGVTSMSFRWVDPPGPNDIGSRRIIQEMLNLDRCEAPSTPECTDPSCPSTPQSVPPAPLAYQQSSGVFTGCDSVVDPLDDDVSLVRNLLHIPIMGLVSVNDPQDVIDSMRVLDETMNALGALKWSYTTGLSSQHTWNIYQTFGIDAFFRPLKAARLSLNLPTQAHVLVADNPDPSELPDNRYYFHFRPTRGLATELGQFHWQIEPGFQNRLTLKNVANLTTLRVRTGNGLYDSKLMTNITLSVKFKPIAQDLDVVLEGYASPPAQVMLGTDLPGWPDPIQEMFSPQNWVHSGSTLTLKHVAGSQYDQTWIVTP